MFAPDTGKTYITSRDSFVTADTDDAWWNLTVNSPSKEKLSIEVEDSRPNNIINEGELQISNLLVKEIISEANQVGKESKIAAKVVKEQCLEKIGIAENQEGQKTPMCGKTKQKRGRKSLKELRESARQEKEQAKIFDLLNNGKGKCLPKEQ